METLRGFTEEGRHPSDRTASSNGPCGLEMLVHGHTQDRDRVSAEGTEGLK